MKKLISFFFIIFTSIALTVNPVVAAPEEPGTTAPSSAPTISSPTSEFMKDAAAENTDSAPTNLGSFNSESLNRTAYTLVINGVGDDLLGAKGYDQYYGKGILPSAIETTAYLFNRPVNTATYVADVLHNTGLVKQAYAQGIGFAGLNPILSIWKACRNMAYFAFIIVFVIVGFMIMLRKKISSNAVATVQEVLPKLIVTLILITFSYAIAGFMVDLLYLSIYLIAAIFKSAGLITDANATANVLFNRNIIGIGISFFTGVTEPAKAAADAMSTLLSQVIGGLLGWGANIFFYLVFIVSVLIAVFKTFIQLVTAYIGIILSTIFAPITLLPNAFPGSDAFQKWLRGLFANIAVFPTAAVMVLLALVLSGSSKPVIPGTENGQTAFGITPSNNAAGFDSNGFLPPLLYSSGTYSGGTVSAVKSLIGFGMIMLLPEVVKMVKKALEVKEEGYAEAAVKNAQGGWASTGGVVVGAGKQVIGQTVGAFGMAAGKAGWDNIAAPALRNLSNRISPPAPIPEGDNGPVVTVKDVPTSVSNVEKDDQIKRFQNKLRSRK